MNELNELNELSELNELNELNESMNESMNRLTHFIDAFHCISISHHILPSLIH